MTDVYVIGVDMTKFQKAGTGPNVDVLGSLAALGALDDCGLKIQDMQAFYCGNLGQASGMVGQRILQQIGQTGIPVVNVANACATGATAFREAWTVGQSRPLRHRACGRRRKNEFRPARRRRQHRHFDAKG